MGGSGVRRASSVVGGRKGSVVYVERREGQLCSVVWDRVRRPSGREVKISVARYWLFHSRGNVSEWHTTDRGVDGNDGGRTSMKSARSSASEPLRSSRPSCGSIVVWSVLFRRALCAFRFRALDGARADFWIMGPERHSRKAS